MLNFEKNKRILWATVIITLILCSLTNCSFHKEKGIVERITQLENENKLIVQLAELEIDSLQLETYKVMLQEGIQTSVKMEQGVLAMYAMEEESNPTKITVVEIYASQEAYESHIASPHFQKYKKGTLSMVDSLKLTRMKPIKFAAKTN